MIITLIGAGESAILEVPAIFKGEIGDLRPNDRLQLEATVIPATSYANALVLSQLLILQRLSAIVNGRLVEWIRRTGGPCLVGGWVPATTESNTDHFGAVGDGVANDVASVTAAWNYAKSTSRILYIPAGAYNLRSATSSLEPESGMVVYGDGMFRTRLHFNGKTNYHPIRRAPNLSRLDGVEFRDFSISGGHGEGGDFSRLESQLFLIYGADNVSFTRIKAEYSRTMAIATRACMGVTVSECVVQYCARDGINVGDCSFGKVINNLIQYCDDDAIAIHASIPLKVDRGHTVTGNVIRFSQGIKLLGAKNATITGNTLEFCFGHGIAIHSLKAPGNEGINGGNGVTITGNTLKNCVNRSIIDGLNSTCPYIYVSGEAAQSGDLAAIPGENDPATGTIVPLYPYFENSQNSITTGPIPNNYNLTISGNVLVRDVPAGVLVSTLGFGQFYTRTGPVDAMLTEEGFRTTGVTFAPGTLKNVSVTGNVISGIGPAFYLLATSRVINGIVANNTVFDCENGLAVAGGNTLHNTLAFKDNVFDIDPLMTHPNRGPNGTWLTNGNPTAILLQGATGFSFGGNTFKNCGRVSDAVLTQIGIVGGSRVEMLSENILECEPVAEGFSTANKGIGFVLRGPGFIHRIVNSDPSSATYGNILNHCAVFADGVPTAGTYVRGHMVRNNNVGLLGTAGNRYIVTGWTRLTTGTNHVVGIDWIEHRVLTGT